MIEFLQNLVFSSWKRTLFAIFSLAVIIRILFIVTLQDNFYFVDSPIYSDAGSHLAKFGEFPVNYDRAPGYALFLAGIYTFFDQNILAIRILQVVLGACIAVAIAVLGKRIDEESVGIVAGIFWAIYPMGVFIAGLVYPTTVMTLLLICGVSCLVVDTGEDRNFATAALGGIFLGLTVLTKPVAMITVVFIAFWIVYWRKTDRLLLLCIFVLGTMVSIVPWTVRNAYIYHKLIPIEARGFNSDVVPWLRGNAESSDEENTSLIESTWSGARRLATRLPREFAYFWELYPQRVNMTEQSFRDRAHERRSRIAQFTVFGTSWTTAVSILSVGPMFLLAIVGVWIMWREKVRRRELSLLCLVIFSFAIGSAVSWGKIRYRIPVEPYIIIMSAYGFMYVWNNLVRRRSK